MAPETVTTVPKLEFVPIPNSITEHCLVPMPPLDSEGNLAYEDVPVWTAEVLGILEGCNLQLTKIRELMELGVEANNQNE